MLIRLYRLLLRAYPRDFRDRHGSEMVDTLAERWRTERLGRGRLRLLWLFLADFLTSVVHEWRGGGAVTDIRLPSRRSRWTMTDLLGDLRLAWRHLWRSPLFTAGAVLTLGFGIGATTAIFSLADATVLRPLPIQDADRVVQSEWSWSLPDFRDLERDQDVFDQVAAWTGLDVAVELEGTTTVVQALGVSQSFFVLCGLEPASGRLLGPADDRPGAPAVVVLGHRLWRDRFGGDPSIVGRSIRLNQRPVTVVGVAPRRFRGFSLRERPELFVSLSALPDLATGPVSRADVRASRDMVWLQVVGRLGSGVPLETARAATEQIYRRAHPPEAETTRIPEPVVLSPVTARAGGVDLRYFLYVLVAATVTTLLLASAAVGGLLVVRTQGRQREFAIRAALGGSRVRLVRLLVAEHVMLGLVAALVGTGGAALVLALLGAFQLPDHVAIGTLEVGLNGSLLAMACGLGLLTSVLFGLAPLWHASGASGRMALAAGSRGVARRPVRASLLATQVAVCVVLLGGGLAFGRAIQQAGGADLGFDTQRTAVVAVDPGLARRSPAETQRFQAESLERVRALPSVVSAAWAKLRPFTGAMMWEVVVPGSEAPRSRDIADRVAEANLVSDGYFETLGIPVLDGRAFSAADRPTSMRVVVVSESMAAKYWPAASPIGRQLSTDLSLRDPAQLYTVIGVVGDIRRGLAREQAPTMYMLAAQHPDMSGVGGHYLFVRAAQEPAAAAAAAAAIISQMDPDLPVTGMSTLRQAFSETLMAQRLGLTLFLLFAVATMTLTGLGLYAATAFAVALRRREIGIRVALGASRSSVVSLVTRQGLTPVIAGLAVGGLVLRLGASSLERFLLSAPAFDTGSLALPAAIILLLTTLAVLAPARHALGIDPTIALKGD